MSKNLNKSKNLKKLLKISKNQFFSKKSETLKNIFLWQKKCYPLSFPILGIRDSTRALQSSPFKSLGGLVQAWRRRTEDEGRRTKEILVFNIGYCSELLCVCVIQGHLTRICDFAKWCAVLLDPAHCSVLSVVLSYIVRMNATFPKKWCFKIFR